MILTLGDMVRIQPNHISFNSIQAIEDIHGTKTKVHKGRFYKDVGGLPELPPNIVSATYVS
jgi:hypothetical protein